MAERPIDRRKKKEKPNRQRRYTVAVDGFSEFERTTLSSFFRLAARRSPSYVEVREADRCDFVIADADRAAVLRAASVSGRAGITVFIGKLAPEGAMAWLPRPIDPMHIMRELDSMVELRHTVPGAVDEPAGSHGIDLLLDDLSFTAATATATATAAAATDAATDAASPVAAPGNVAATGPDVLVVEDSAIARRFLQLRLQRLGYAVYLASDADEAVAWLQSRAFALVFLDVALGPADGLDGLNLCHMVKHDPAFAVTRAAKVVIVSGLSGSTDRVRGSLAGCDAYLTKPVNEAEFQRTVQTLDPRPPQRPARVRTAKGSHSG